MPVIKKKISEIAKDLWENCLSEKEKEKNSSGVMAKKLNIMLMESGDLMEGAYGKQETKQGHANGIEGELIAPENQNRYWLPMYTEKGARYVHSLFEEHRDKIVVIPEVIDDSKVPQTPIIYRYSRRIWKEMKEKYRDFQIIAMEEESRYWIFDEDAELLEQLFHLQINNAKHGKNITITKENNISKSVLKKLRDAGIPYVIVHPQNEEVFNAVEEQTPTKITIDDRPIVGLGREFEMREENGEDHRYVILEEGDNNEMMTITLADGSVDVITVPRFDENGAQRISPRTPLARALINAHEGETVAHNGELFTITKLI